GRRDATAATGEVAAAVEREDPARCGEARDRAEAAAVGRVAARRRVAHAATVGAGGELAVAQQDRDALSGRPAEGGSAHVDDARRGTGRAVRRGVEAAAVSLAAHEADFLLDAIGLDAHVVAPVDGVGWGGGIAVELVCADRPREAEGRSPHQRDACSEATMSRELHVFPPWLGDAAVI